MFDLKSFRKVNNITQKQLADFLGCTQAYISLVEKGENKLSDEYINKIMSDKTYIISDDSFDREQSKNEVRFRMSESNHGLKSLFFQSHVAVRLVTTKARAGFAGAYYADEYLDDFPTVLIETDKEYRGNYLAFEVDGDSMEPEYYRGDVVICREVKRDLWRYKLHIDEWDFVIAHSTKGIMLKQIVDHNVETGEIICHSLNSEEHPDFTLNLKEISFLYNVVEHRISGKNKRRYR